MKFPYLGIENVGYVDVYVLPLNYKSHDHKTFFFFPTLLYNLFVIRPFYDLLEFIYGNKNKNFFDVKSRDHHYIFFFKKRYIHNMTITNFKIRLRIKSWEGFNSGLPRKTFRLRTSQLRSIDIIFFLMNTY